MRNLERFIMFQIESGSLKMNQMKTRINSSEPLAPELLLRVIRQICILLLCGMVSLFCLTLTELLNRGSARLFFVWTAAHTDWLYRTLALLACWNLFWICLRGKPSAGVRWANGLVILLSLVNYYKKEFRAEPFELTDLTQAKEGLGIVAKVHPKLTPIAAVSLIAVLIVIPLFFPHKKLAGGFLRWLLRVLISSALLAVCFAFFLSKPIAESWRVSELYSNGGFLRGLAETMPKNGFREPEGYTEEAAAEALERLNGQKEAAVPSGTIITPDIVFIMSESLYDLEKPGALDLSADPLAEFRALQKEFSGGEIMALGYGGGTYYSEYEVLTGYRVSDTPGQLYYDSSVTREGMATVLSVLKKHGYSAKAIHPNDGGFYRRAYNYRCMGFDETLFKGDGIGALEPWINGFPSDRALFSFVSKVYSDWASEGSRFMHIVTYQNHGSYGGKPKRSDISVQNREGNEKQAAENFANGILEHTEALTELLGFFAAQERPVVVVVWGDHAPNMKEFGIEMPESAREKVPFYLTPLLIWNNYGAEIALPDDGIVPPYRLGALLLSQLGFLEDPYYTALENTDAPDLMTVLRLLNRDGTFYSDDDEYNSWDQALRMIHYDRLVRNGSIAGENER